MRNNPYDFSNLADDGIDYSTGLPKSSFVQRAIIGGMSEKDAMLLEADRQLKQSQAKHYEYQAEKERREAMQQELTQQRLNELGINDPSDVQGNFERLIEAGVDPTKAGVIATQMGQLVFDQQKTALQNQTNQAKDTRSQEDVYRKEYIGASKEFKEVSRAYSKIHKALNQKDPSASDDMAAVYALIKLFDPTTGVKESEYAKAEDLKGVPEWMRLEYNKARSGNILTPQMRQRLNRTAKDLYSSEKDANKKIKSQYKALSERAGLNPENVLLDYNAPEDEEELTQEQRERARYEQLKAIKQRRGF